MRRLGLRCAGLLFFLHPIACLGFADSKVSETDPIKIGSKSFTESYILAELAAQWLEQDLSIQVTRRFGLGGTGILHEALLQGEIDFYPEYTGTVKEVILKDTTLQGADELRAALLQKGIIASKSLGFSNAYALAMKEEKAKSLGIRRISDLKRHPELRAGFSNEFVKRPDGLPQLKKTYELEFKHLHSLEHSLAYEALRKDQVDLMEVYTTDAKLESMNLQLLVDDRKSFPVYQAIWLARRDWVEKNPDRWQRLKEWEEAIHEKDMIRFNAKAESERKSFSIIAAQAIEDLKGLSLSHAGDATERRERLERVWKRTQQHLILIFVALFAALAVGLPMGIFASRYESLKDAFLMFSSVIQTIPSLALLCFLIPVFGIGTVPALVALALYSLLPIVSNTFLGLSSIDSRLIEASRALGMGRIQRLLWIQLPLASPQIILGVRNAAIMCIGTATLAALIGAGGYGAPIVTGLALNHIPTVLEGALPAAGLALVAYGCFSMIARVIIPRGLKVLSKGD